MTDAVRTHNPNCDGNRCYFPDGEVRVYPLGGSGNLILCMTCFVHENRYREKRAKETGCPENFPQASWADAEVYGGKNYTGL